MAATGATGGAACRAAGGPPPPPPPPPGGPAPGAGTLGACYNTAGCSVLDVSGAVVGPLTRAGPEKGH